MQRNKPSLTGQSAPHFNPVSLFSLVYIIIIALGIDGAAASEFCAAGYANAAVYWNVSTGMAEVTQTAHCGDQEIAINLSEELTGPSENSAGAQSVGSLALCWQSAYGSGITPNIEAGIGIGNANSEFKDRLTFTIPAGTYNEDVIVRLRGWVRGTFTITGDGVPSGRAAYYACFGVGNCVSWIWYDTDGWAFSKNFLLTQQLLAAGTSLTDPLILNHTINSILSANGQSSNRHIASGFTEISAALYLLDENLPSGVSWLSDSGAFYKEPLCPGDFGADGSVDSPDLDLFVSGFGRSDCEQGDACPGDLNGDNDTDGSDLNNFLTDFGRTDCSHF